MSHVRRYDMDIVPTPDLTLEFGDRGLPFAATRTQGGGEDLFRRSRPKRPRYSAMCRWVSAWFWVYCLALIPILILGVGVVTLGIAGGPLIVALTLGKLRRARDRCFGLCLSPANIVLRNFGLAYEQTNG